MPLELESYLNVPRISEIEPFPAACAPRTVYVRHFVRWPSQDGASHAVLLCRRHTTLVCHDHFSCFATSRQAACWNFLWLFSAAVTVLRPTHGTFRVFMIGIQDVRWKIRRADETLVCVMARYQGVLCSRRQSNLRGVRNLWLLLQWKSLGGFAQQIVLSCINIWICFFKSKALPTTLRGISALNIVTTFHWYIVIKWTL